MMPANGTNTALRRRTVLAAAIAAVGLACAAGADADADLVGLKVVDRDTGQVLRTWRHHGRLFVAGEPGARYALRVINRTDGRVLVVMSVDGVNILTGETASYGQRGYVFDSYQSYDLNGWRKTNTEVAAFSFAPLPQSYAARTGRPSDVGVIGMAVFTERAPVEVQVPYAAPPVIQRRWLDDSNRSYSGGTDANAARAAPPPTAGFSVLPAPRAALAPPPPPPPSDMAKAQPAAPSAFAGVFALRPRDDKLGTAHGAREWSVVNITTFERATDYPQSIRQIEYDTYARLVASGVIPPSPYAQRRPRPFPLNPDGEGYVPDPPIEP